MEGKPPEGLEQWQRDVHNLYVREQYLKEMKAKAMLMGLAYDPTDHTFHNVGTDAPEQHAGPLSIKNRGAIVLDADTLEEVSGFYFGGDKDRASRATIFTDRQKRVLKGEIGWQKDCASSLAK